MFFSMCMCEVGGVENCLHWNCNACIHLHTLIVYSINQHNVNDFLFETNAKHSFCFSFYILDETFILGLIDNWSINL